MFDGFYGSLNIHMKVQVQVQVQVSRTLHGCKMTVVLFAPCVVPTRLLWVGSITRVWQFQWYSSVCAFVRLWFKNKKIIKKNNIVKIQVRTSSFMSAWIAESSCFRLLFVTWNTLTHWKLALGCVALFGVFFLNECSTIYCDCLQFYKSANWFE